MKENIIAEKAYAFSVRIVRLYCTLKEQHRWEHALFEQMLRSGTSIGANVNEANYAQSRRDFACKMNIALKEASETLYWLRLLTDTGFVTPDTSETLQKDCVELLKILTAILNSTKEKRNPAGIST